MCTIYVLLCENNCYYIGKTTRPISERVEEHFNNCGSEWTKLNKVIKVVETKMNADDFDEDKYTKMYMRKYGIDKVRGGTYTQVTLPYYSKKTLEKELCTATDLCFRCNRSGHFAHQCYAKMKVIHDSQTEHIKPETTEKTDEGILMADLTTLIHRGITAISYLKSAINIRKVVIENNNTKLETDAITITKIRENNMASIELEGKRYKILTTKRDLGLFAGSKNNYIVVEGCHDIVPKTYSL